MSTVYNETGTTAAGTAAEVTPTALAPGASEAAAVFGRTITPPALAAAVTDARV
jgi:hypothetical protein